MVAVARGDGRIRDAREVLDRVFEVDVAVAVADRDRDVVAAGAELARVDVVVAVAQRDRTAIDLTGDELGVAIADLDRDARGTRADLDIVVAIAHFQRRIALHVADIDVCAFVRHGFREAGADRCEVASRHDGFSRFDGQSDRGSIFLPVFVFDGVSDCNCVGFAVLEVVEAAIGVEGQRARHERIRAGFVHGEDPGASVCRLDLDAL